MLLNQILLDVIACPICKGKLHYNKGAQSLSCKFDKVLFPIRNGVPIMLAAQAKPIDLVELEKH